MTRGVALVTGATRRLGRVLALAAARAGHDLALHYRSDSGEAEETVAAVRSLGRQAIALPCDLADAAALPGLLAAASALGPVTLLVNSASLFAGDRLETTTANLIDDHMAVNLTAPVLLSQAFARALPEGRRGLIVHMLDQRVWRPNPQFFSYSLSKAALWHATQTMAQDLAPRIRVNAIGPGPTLPSIHQVPGEFEAEAAGTLLQQPVDPEEMGHALRYLIDAGSVTGQMIAVDSGQHLGWRTPDIVQP
jgi:NAD(P)-dependent dehydrogenase (short-subunit alcohol dehydrogenase family)